MYFPIGFSREISDNSYPSQHTIQYVSSHWLQQGDFWQFLSKSAYHTRCVFPLASIGRYLAILIQVSLPYKMYFPIGFTTQGDSWQFLSKSPYHTRYSFPLVSGGGGDSWHFLSKSATHTRCIFPLASTGRFLAILVQVSLPYKMYFPIGFSKEISGNSYPSQLTI